MCATAKMGNSNSNGFYELNLEPVAQILEYFVLFLEALSSSATKVND